MTETFYDVLGVPPDASQAAIRDAYRDRVKETHPDVSEREDAEERFKRVKRAEEVLADPDERDAYDRLGHATYVDGSQGHDEPDVGPVDDEVRAAAARAADGEHDAGGHSAAWRERERRARSRGRDYWAAHFDGFADDASTDRAGSGIGDFDPTPDADARRSRDAGRTSGTAGADATGEAAGTDATGADGAPGGSGGVGGSGTGPRDGAVGESGIAGGAGSGSPTGTGGQAGTAPGPGSTARTGASVAGTNAPASGVGASRREHVADDGAAPDGWGGETAASHTYAVRDWEGTGQGFVLRRPGWTQDDVALLVATMFLYPIMLFMTVLPLFPVVANVAIGLLTISYVAFLLPRPSLGIPVFGTWSLLMPAFLLGFEVPIVSVIGLVTLSGVWLPLLYSVAVALVLVRQ